MRSSTFTLEIEGLGLLQMTEWISFYSSVLFFRSEIAAL